MSRKSLAVQTPTFTHADRPGLHDLLTINLTIPDMWYNIGLELGLSISVLDGIKTKYAKPQPCKRAMFKEWLNTCPSETCTWFHLIQAFKKIDPKTAEVIADTITSSPTSAKSDRPHTSLFPVRKNEKKEVDVTSTSAASLPSSLMSGRRERPWTEIFHDPSTSLPIHKAAIPGQQVSTSTLKSEGRIEDDYSHLMSYDDQSHESKSRSSHGSSEMRSFSAEEYQTASEDDSIQPFMITYQQDVEQSVTFGSSNDPVSMILASVLSALLILDHFLV